MKLKAELQIEASMDAKYCHSVRPPDIFVRPWTHSPPIFGVHALNLCVRDAGTPLNGTSGPNEFVPL